MVVYLDSSVLVRAYLPNEVDHASAAALLDNDEITLLTGTWTRIEVSGALVRAARSGRADERAVLAVLDADLASDGPVTVVSASQEAVEASVLRLVRAHALRAMDAWHLATAKLISESLLDPGEVLGFASRDAAQLAVASTLGLQPV